MWQLLKLAMRKKLEEPHQCSIWPDHAHIREITYASICSFCTNIANQL